MLAGLAGLGALIVSSTAAMAEGSGNLYAAGTGSRANSEWRTSNYGAGVVDRRTLLHAYAVAGELLLMGSSAMGNGSADIAVWNPGQVTGNPGQETIPATPTFSCATQRAASSDATLGQILSRAEELAGPDTVPSSVSNGYHPCVYPAPVTGIYSVAMYGPAGSSADSNGGVADDVGLTNANDFNSTQGTSVAAWDLTVRGSLTDATTTRTGRVFAYSLALFTGGNGLPVNLTTYVVTLDGFRYRSEDRGMDPNGWVQYANQVGFLDPDGSTPLYHDAVALSQGNPAQLTNIQAGVLFAHAQYPVFLEPPADATLTALGIPLTAVAPQVSNATFSGSWTGSSSYLQTGGTFSYTSNVSGVYEIVISRDGVNFDPSASQNRVLRGTRSAGTQTVSWDGKDNSGAFLPIGTGYHFRMRVHAGEYHFPFIDVENDVNGGPSITLLNAPNGNCPPLTGGCSGGFYDDRGYTTTTAQTVGTLGSVLCGNEPPATPASDPVNGFDTSSAQRAFGTASGGNTNVPCTGSFGDAKGLDLWTYYPSPFATGQLNIVGPPDDLALTITGPSTLSDGDSASYVIQVHNNGPNPAGGPVTVVDTLPPGVNFTGSSGSGWSCTASGQTVTCTQSAALPSGSSEPPLTINVSATSVQPGSTLTDSARVSSPSPDSNLSNNNASTVATVPGGTSTTPNPVSNPSTPSTGAGETLGAGALLLLLGGCSMVLGCLLRQRRAHSSSRLNA